MNPIKIAFFDIDGTLIDLDLKRMTEPVKHTLLELQKQGVRLCIATGRGPMTIPRIQGITFDTYLTFNGSYCFDREGDIFSNPIPKQDVLTVIRNARSLGRTVSVATKTELGIQKRIPRSGLAVIWREKPTWVLAGEYPGRYLRRPKECPSRQKKLVQPSGRCARVRDTLTAQTYAAEAPQPREKIWQLTMTATQTLSGRAPATGQTSGRSSP